MEDSVKTSSVEKISLNKHEYLSYLKEFTKIHKRFFKNDPYLCEAHALSLQFKYSISLPLKQDIFAGRGIDLALGFSPQVYSDRGGFGYYCDENKLDKQLEVLGFNAVEISEIDKIKSYWRSYDSVKLTRQQYPNWLEKVLPSDNWTTEPGIAFPLYRMAGAQLDFKLLIEQGIPGLKEIVRSEGNNKDENKSFYKALLIMLEGFSSAIRYFAEKIDKRLIREEDTEEKNHLDAIVNSLRHIADRKPESLHQGIQLVFLYTMLAGVQNYGRMDDYLGELLENDLNKGHIDEADAIQYMVGLFDLMDTRKTIYDGRLILGGKGRHNEHLADKFAVLAIEASKRSGTVLPQVTLRTSKDQDPALWNKAMEVLATGWVYPMLYNDDINIPSVQKAFKVGKQTAEQYVPYGCGEYVLYHMSFGTPSSVLNTTKALEVLLNGGRDHITSRIYSIDVPENNQFIDFDTFLDRYKSILKLYIKALAFQEKIEYDVAAQTGPFLTLSLLYDDCIKRGKGIFEGGVRYLGGTLETYGNTNTVDSLYAIKKLVFDQKKYNLEQMNDVLLRNYEGFDTIHSEIMDLPKYGNDHSVVDEMYQELHDYICTTTRDMAGVVGLDNFLVVVINNDANTDLGKQTLASADGRRSFESLNNGHAAYHGNDKSGITALLNTLSKPRSDIHAGAVQNLKFSKSMFRDHRPELESLLKGYFNNGGTQAMLTVVDKNDLVNAVKEPGKYSNLFVRVGGFSARFIDLRPEVQQEIINRTLY